jgi:hypothetical protein
VRGEQRGACAYANAVRGRLPRCKACRIVAGSRVGVECGKLASRQLLQPGLLLLLQPGLQLLLLSLLLALLLLSLLLALLLLSLLLPLLLLPLLLLLHPVVAPHPDVPPHVPHQRLALLCNSNICLQQLRHSQLLLQQLVDCRHKTAGTQRHDFCCWLQLLV